MQAAHGLKHIPQPGDVPGQERRGRAEDEKFRPDARIPELFRLVIASHCHVLHADLLQLPGHLHGAVAVGIGLHHAQIPAARRELGTHTVHIMFQISQADLRPGPFLPFVHLLSVLPL